MLQEKRMLEQQLLETAGELAVAERELTGSQLGGSAPSVRKSPAASYNSDSDDESAPSGHGDPLPRHISRLAELSARELESLRTENDALMKVRTCVVTG
jgi:hypothetical protein